MRRRLIALIDSNLAVVDLRAREKMKLKRMRMVDSELERQRKRLAQFGALEVRMNEGELEDRESLTADTRLRASASEFDLSEFSVIFSRPRTIENREPKKNWEASWFDSVVLLVQKLKYSF